MQYHLVGVTSTIELFECLAPAMKPAMNLNICQCISLVRTATYQISFCASAESRIAHQQTFCSGTSQKSTRERHEQTWSYCHPWFCNVRTGSRSTTVRACRTFYFQLICSVHPLFARAASDMWSQCIRHNRARSLENLSHEEWLVGGDAQKSTVHTFASFQISTFDLISIGCSRTQIDNAVPRGGNKIFQEWAQSERSGSCKRKLLEC